MKDRLFDAAYDAMLQTGRALMFLKGYGLKSSEHYVAVVLFVEAVYSNKFPNDVFQKFSKARL
ncbi:MAG: hypothetical protein KGI27_00035 [Thaumarchaeota archaeon]|nr:hypothetical protein [Nitrososphaerota archaeon]